MVGKCKVVDSCYCFLMCYNGIKLKCKISRGIKFSRLFVLLKIAIGCLVGWSYKGLPTCQ